MADAWRNEPLSSLEVEVLDCDHRTPKRQLEGMPYVTIPEMRGGRIDLQRARRISHENFQSWTRKALPQEHDVVLSRRTNPGETALVRKGQSFALGQNLVLLRSTGKRVHPPYLYWVTKSPAWWREISRFLNVGAIFDSLRIADIRHFSVPAPPLAEQVAIAAVLGALDDKIELNRRMNETLEQIAAACFSHWFSRGGQQNDEGVGAGVARNIVEFDPTERLKRGTVAPHLGLAELPTEGPIHQPPRLRPFTSGARFRNRDTLLARITPSLENGKTALANGLPHGIVAWGSTEIIVMRARQGVPFSVPYLLARDASFRARAVRSMSGTSGRQRVPREALEDEPISIPPKHRLLEFGELVDPMFDAMFAKARESETLAAIRDALLPKLIAGELRIRDAERVVGEVV